MLSWADTSFLSVPFALAIAASICRLSSWDSRLPPFRWAGRACGSGFFPDQRCLAARFDASGEFVWPDSYVYLSRPGRKSAGLMSQPYGKDGSWLVDWSDGGTSADDKDETFLMMVLNEDGTLGADDSGVSEVAADVAWTLCFDGRALCAPVADGTTATLYDAAGVRVASAVFAGGKAPVALPGGLYVAKVGEKSVKFAL